MALRPSDDYIYSGEYVTKLTNLRNELDTTDKRRAIVAALGLVELAFSRGVPIENMPQVVDSLLTMLSMDVACARSAAWALYWLCGGNGQGRQGPALTPQVATAPTVQNVLNQDDLDPTVAVFLLAILQSPAARARDIINSVGPQIAPRLLCYLDDPDPVVRSNTILAIQMIRYQQAIEPLIARLKKDEDANVRRHALSTLSELGDEKMIEPFWACLQDDDHRVRREAVRALGKTGNPEVVERLIRTLEDKNDNVADQALDTLNNLVRHDHVDILLPLLKHTSSDVRQRVTRLLVLLDEESLVKSVAPEALVEYRKGRFAGSR